MKKTLVLLALCSLAIDACEQKKLSVAIQDGLWRVESDGNDHALLWCTLNGIGSGRVISTSGKRIEDIILSPDKRYIAFKTDGADSGYLFWDIDRSEFAKTSIDPELNKFIKSLPVKKASKTAVLKISPKIQALQMKF